jgi:hypothetical protein
MATGVVGQITAFTKPTATIAGLASVLTTDNKITVAGATSPGNNGTFPITLVVSGASVKYANVGAVNPDAAGAHLTWTTSRGIILNDVNGFGVSLALSFNVNNHAIYKFTGWYATGGVWEAWTGSGATTPPPSGHALTNVTVITLSGGVAN